MRTILLVLLVALAVASTQLPAQTSGGPFTVQENGRAYARLQDAVDAIGDRDGTITIASGRYRDCAVQSAGRVAYRAAEPGKAVFEGGICQDKATLVLDGADAMVEGLVFTGQRVADGNGAGIRLEQGGLDVRDTVFRDAESGILSGDDQASSIRIDRSTFSGLGRCDRDLDCAHSIYIGRYGSLGVAGSSFELLSPSDHMRPPDLSNLSHSSILENHSGSSFGFIFWMACQLRKSLVLQLLTIAL